MRELKTPASLSQRGQQKIGEILLLGTAMGGPWPANLGRKMTFYFPRPWALFAKEVECYVIPGDGYYRKHQSFAPAPRHE